jgi:hypothetical protein
MSDVWYYAEGEKSVGPLTLTELTVILSRVSVANEVLVWRGGLASWIKAENVPELSACVKKSPAVLTSPPPVPPKTLAGQSEKIQTDNIRASSPVFRRWFYMKNGNVFESTFLVAVSNWIVGLLVFTAVGLVAAVWFSGTYLPFVTLMFGFPPRPILGLILFLVFFSVGIGTLTRYGLWLGNCPHCDQEVAVKAGRNGAKAIDCPICTKRIFLKEGQYRAV